MFIRCARAIAGVVLLVAAAPAWPQNVTIPDEYAKHIKQRDTQLAPESAQFGDRVSLGNGALEIVQTDVSLPGNNALPVRVGRRFRNEPYARGLFGYWDLDVPHAHGVFARTVSGGWRVASGNTVAAFERCSRFAAPPEVTHIGGIFPADEYWAGNFFYHPDTGDQELLGRPVANTHVPSDGHSYPVVTKDGAAVRCVALAATSETGSSGEGFEVVMPDGVVYTLNHMVSRLESTLTKPEAAPLERSEEPAESRTVDPEDTSSSTTAPVNYILPRQEVFLYPTQVTDRFGNTVTYTWSSTNPWQLLQITASDGRQLTFGYPGSDATQASSVSDGIRTWTYGYAPPRGIDTVTLPDGTQWGFDLGDLALASAQPSGVSCDTMTAPPGTWTGSITSPSGATAGFTLGAVLMGRAWVFRECIGAYEPSPRVRDPYLFVTLAVTAKTITGPGLPPAGLTWSYAYGPPNHCWNPAGVPTSPYAIKCTISSPTTRTVTVTDPDGNATRHTHGNAYRINEGLALQVDHGWTGSSALRTVVTDYAATDAAPYATFNGYTVRNVGDYDTTGKQRPVRQVATTQQGTTFTWAVAADCSGVPYCFDAYARPVRTVQASSPGVSRTQATSYFDHPGQWVMGQVASATCTVAVPASASCNGDITRQATFDVVTALPLTQSAFGKLQATFTWDTAGSIPGGQRGTLKTVKDGNHHLTTYGNWHRGIPQAVQYADTTSESALVNAQGWITALTDETGATTGYGYDAMGRLASISYPGGDSTTWNATTIATIPVTTTEYGIAGGHWRRTESTGNARKVTYFDALWRPLLTREYDTADVAGTQRFHRFAYDAQGRVTFAAYPGATDALTTGTWSEFDALGRPTSVSQDSELGVLATQYAYLTGFKTQITNPRTQVTTSSYLAWDTPTTDYPTLIDHPEGAYTHIARDPFGKPTSIRRSNNASPTGGTMFVHRDYAYNDAQELCRVVEPETGVALMGYDPAGNLIWSASGLPAGTACDAEGDTAAILARKAVRTFDARNRIATLAFPDANGNQSWSYTPDGLPASVTTYNDAGSSSVVNTYAWNKRRLPVTETVTQTDNPNAWAIGYGYDGNANPASLVYPGLTLSIASNALGQATAIASDTQVFANAISYFPNGAPRQFTYGNGIVHTLTQNDRGLPDRSRDADGSTAIHDDSYAYDPNGNVLAISDGVAGFRGDRDMVYDGLDRLTAATSPMYGTTGAHYSYDVLDNLTSARSPGTGGATHAYCYDEHWRLTNVKAGTCAGATVTGLGYDVQGNLNNKNGTAYGFDYGNRLRTGGPETYRYDAHGRRARSSTSAGLIYSLYGQSGQILFQRDERTGQRRHYVYLGSSLLAERTRPIGSTIETITWQHTDALGSPVATTNSARVVLQRSEYEPYGRLLNRPIEDGPGYTGHITDAATGLVYMQQRYYDPGIPRFLSVDPVTAYSDPIGAFHRYRYANNNPYKFIDPDGRNGVAFVGGVATETWNALTGRGFDGDMVMGALKDGYNGEGDGFARAAIDDATSFIPTGALAGGAVKLTRVLTAFVRTERLRGLAKMSGVLRSAAAGKGNFSIGSATAKQSNAMGRAWVGKGYTTASDGKTLVSKDGLRQYRPPSAKNSQHAETGVQSNFEQRVKPDGKWQSNAHLDIQ